MEMARVAVRPDGYAASTREAEKAMEKGPHAANSLAAAVGFLFREFENVS
jgi:hypothetical protein